MEALQHQLLDLESFIHTHQKLFISEVCQTPVQKYNILEGKLSLITFTGYMCTIDIECKSGRTCTGFINFADVLSWYYATIKEGEY